MKTKKNFLKKLTAGLLGFVMTLGVGAAGYATAASETHAADTSISTLTFPDDNSANNKKSTYTDTWTAKNKLTGTTTALSWTISNFNNNSWNNSWTYIKCGRKNNASTGTITTPSITDYKITSIAITFGAIGNVSSINVYSGTSASGTSIGTMTTSGTGTKTVNISNSNYGGQYTVAIACTSASSNGPVRVDKVELFGQKKASTFNVTYNSNGATSGSVPTDATAYNSGATVTIKGNTGNLEKTGYTFDGWYSNTSGTGGTAYAVGSTFSITAAKTLYAKWNLNSYTVGGTIENGSLSSTANISHGTAFSRTINPGTGYDYPTSLTSLSINGVAQTAGVGYSYNSANGEISIDANKVVGNIVISAECPIKKYTVSANITHGTLSNTGSINHGTAFSATLSGTNGFNVPDEEDVTITIGGSPFTDFSYVPIADDQATIEIAETYVTGDIIVTATCSKWYSISASCPGGSVSQDSDSEIKSDSTAYIQFEADDEHFLPLVDGISVINAVIIDYAEGLLEIGNPTGDVTVVCTCIEITSKSVSVTMTNVTNIEGTGSDVIEIGGGATVRLDASPGYRLPAISGFNVTGAEASIVLSNNNTHAEITLSNCTDDVVISGSAIKVYSVTTSIINGSCSPASATVDSGSSWSTTITPSSGYKLPTSITVTIGGNPATSGSDYTYNSSTGAVSIASVSGAVSITATMVELAFANISVSGSGNYADKFTYSGATSLTEGSTAQITITPKTEGSDVYFIKSSDIDVVGASVVSYTDNVLTIGSLSVGVSSVDITVTPQLKAINGIVLKTQPTTKTYNIGVPFSTSGAVVHAQYNDGSEGTENIVSSCYPVFYTGGVEDAAAMFKNGSHTVKFAYDVGENTYLTSAVNLTVNKVQHSGTVTFTKTAPTTGSFLIATKDDSGNWYYLPTATASNAGPAKQTLTMVNNLPSFDSSIAASTYMWNLSYSNNKYTITNSDNKYLFANNSNSGLRVNTTSDTWTISATTNGYKMLETNNSRYCGVYVDGSDWRPYNSSSAANYKGTGENIVFFTRTENPGTHEYAGIVAELADPQHQFFAGQSVENSQLTVKKYYDDEVGTETLTNDQFEISGHTLVAGWNTITVSHSGKTDTLRVYATERTGELVDAKIVASSGYQTTYWLDDEHSDWNLDNINLVAIYSDESEVSVSLQSLVDSGQVTINPAQPAEGVTSFTVSGSYDDGEKEVPINSDYNTVSGFTINNKVITQLSWAGRFDYSDHSFNVFEGSTINKNRFINSNKQSSYLKATFNDGTPAVDYSIDNCSVALYERDTEKEKNVKVKDVTFDQNGNYTFEAEDDGLYFLLSVGNAITQYSSAAVFHVCERLNAVNIPGSNVTKTISPTSFTPVLPTSTESGVQTYTAEGIGFQADGLYNYSSHIALPKNSSSYLKSNQLPGELVSITFTKSNSQSMNNAASVSFSKDGVTYDLSQQFNNATFTYSFDTAAKKGYKYFKITTTGSNYTNIASISITYTPSNDIANSDFDAQSKVINFVKNNTISFENWDTVEANFNSTFTSNDTFAKNMFKYATALTGDDADILQEFVNSYDSIAKAYNLVGASDNFLNRTLGDATKYSYSVNTNGGTAGGGSSTSSKYTYGATITLPTSITKAGYTFEGWYFDSEFTKPVGENPKTVTTFSMPAGDVTVYAKWTEAIINATFNANGGKFSGDTTEQVVPETYNSNYVLPEANPSKVGYTFAGWFTQAIGGVQVTAEHKFTSTTTVTLYAHWNAAKVNATFNANGGAWEDPQFNNVIEQTYDSNYKLPSSDPIKDGYVFAGWFTEPTGGEQITSLTKFESADAVIVYAHWSQIYDITFSGDHVSLSGETSFLSGEPYNATIVPEPGYLLPDDITITVNEQAFADYDYDQASGSLVIESMPEGDMSISVEVQQGAYKITYMDSDGTEITGHTPNKYYYQQGATLVDLEDKLGYTFGGWYDNPNYDGLPVENILASESGDKTFYAKWVFDGQDELDQVETSIGMSYTYSYRDENAQTSGSSSTNAGSKAATAADATSQYKYVKVTSTDDLTNGTYIIVYEDGGVAFNGALTTLDATNNTVAVTIEDGEIQGSAAIDAATFTFAKSDGSFKGTGGYYFGNGSNSNGLTSSTSALTNTVSIDPSGNLVVMGSGGAYLRYNAASDQLRFRYYKSSSYTAQKEIQIYKQVSAGPTLTSIQIVGTPITKYYVGDTYVTTGLSVQATYSDGTTPIVTADISINKSTAQAGDTSITYSATYEGKNATKVVNVTVQTEYHDVSFKFNFKNTGIDELISLYGDVYDDIGLVVEYGERQRFFSFILDNGSYYIYEYNQNDELVKTTTFKMKTGGVFTLNLGDMINDLDKANTEFTVRAYIVDGDDVYYSSNSTTYSVVSWIEYYYGKSEYRDAVEDLYFIFHPEEK